MTGRHRWIDYAQVSLNLHIPQTCRDATDLSLPPPPLRTIFLQQSEYNASQVPPEWHAWLEHIRLKPPQEDEVVKAVTPPWLGVSIFLPRHLNQPSAYC